MLMKHKEKDVYEQGKLIVKAFFKAGHLRLTELRPFPEMNNNGDMKNWKHWRHWGCYHSTHMKGLKRFDIPDLKLNWFVPGDKEQKVLQSVIDKLVRPIIDDLTKVKTAEIQEDPNKIIGWLEIINGT
eukprot:UN00043